MVQFWKSRVASTVLAAAFAGCAFAAPAVANDASRYAPAPPIVLSPDLAEPWIVQLRPPSYREEVTYVPHVLPRRSMPPISLWQGAPDPQATPDGDRRIVRQANYAPAERTIAEEFLPTEVDYHGPHRPGTIIIDTTERHLYLVEDQGRARRYGVGVGRPGFQWAGEHFVTRKAEWPDWTPPDAMLKRQPNLPRHMDGGPDNPLGARALYLGSTEYRIHGSNEPWTIGHAVSSGCIRMRNEDVTDLYERVKVGTRVIVM